MINKQFFSFLSLWFALAAYGQVKLPDQLYYGVSYYHEYMPEERLDTDMQMMSEAGINLIRVGESTWALYEPSEGEFDFEWLDRVLDKAQKYGIKVIVGTPTYAIPPWMAKNYPEVMVTTFSGQAQYGGRQNMDITNPTYLKFAKRIISKQIDHVRNHPAVIGYQIDNETKSYKTASKYANTLFVDHLRKKFVTVDSLNKAWNLYYWSQNLSRFEDFLVTGNWANQAVWLEWNRFQHQLVTDFLQFQADIVNQRKRPDQFITQNFDMYWRNEGSGGPQPDVDHFNSAKVVDIAGIDIYHPWGDAFDGKTIAFAGDYTRSFKKDNYLVLETQAQSKGWTTIGQTPLYDGQLRLAFYSHLASGANMVSYWPWHSIHNAGETFWKGILSHDMEVNRPYREVQKVADEIKQIGHQLVSLRKDNEVAILYSIESFNALMVKPFSQKLNYADLIGQLHESLYELNVGTDFITPVSNFYDYKVILVPSLYISSDELLHRLAQYVYDGGQLVIMFKSGFCNENVAVRPVLAPGPLAKACGFHYQEFYNTDMLALKAVKLPTAEKGETYRAGEFVELIEPTTAVPLAVYDHPFFGNYPAVTENKYGKGTVIYEGSIVDLSLQKSIVKRALNQAGIKISEVESVLPLVYRGGVNKYGKMVHYFMNYSNNLVVRKYPFEKGINLLDGSLVEKGRELKVESRDLVIIVEE